MDYILLIPSNCKNCNYSFYTINYKFRGFCSGECYFSYYNHIFFSESSILTVKNDPRENENENGNKNEFNV